MKFAIPKVGSSQIVRLLELILVFMHRIDINPSSLAMWDMTLTLAVHVLYFLFLNKQISMAKLYFSIKWIKDRKQFSKLAWKCTIL